jgi:hypothetical protein
VLRALRWHVVVQDFVTVLDQSGAGNISFNPLTGPNLTKALAAIAESEGYRLDPDMGQGLVAGAGGDLRNAVQNLQLMLQGPGVLRSKAGAQKGKVSMWQLLGLEGTVRTNTCVTALQRGGGGCTRTAWRGLAGGWRN